MAPRKVFVCSPLRGDQAANEKRAESYSHFLWSKYGFRPLAPHLLYPRFLDDQNPADRAAGMRMGLADLAESTALFYFLLAGNEPSEGMAAEITEAKRLEIPCFRVDVTDESNPHVWAIAPEPTF